MTSIQGILVAFLLAAAMVASFAFNARVACRLLAVVLLSGAVFLVLFPDLTTRAAHLLGVGRGTDLLLYLRTRELERKLTEQVRAIAIRNAQSAGRA